MMAGTEAARRVKSNHGRTAGEYTFDGSAVRKAQAVPRTGKRSTAERTVSRTAIRNRRKALVMSRGYVFFLAVMCFATVLMCVHFLQLKEMITSQNTENAKLLSELTSLKSENDAMLENVTNNIDWDHIKDVAINELGMKYATQDDVVWYNTSGGTYVRQYQDVPSGE